MQGKAKSIKTIRRLRKKEPKLIEGPKQTLFLRGNKTSTSIMNFLRDMRSLRRKHGAMFARKHDIHPFENQEELQKIAEKSDTSLFMFGSHSKKRPNNVVIGRTYERKVMDMVELGLMNFSSIQQLIASASVPLDVQPFIIFQGDIWQSDDQFRKLRNLLNDFFLMNNRPKGVEIDNLMKVVVCWSATEDKRIYLNIFEVNVEGGNKILEEEGKIIAEELGPNAQFAIRRNIFADEQTMKKAVYVPKLKKKKDNKNITYDNLGNKRGKLYVDRQNLKNMPTKRRRIIQKSKAKELRREKKTQNIGPNHEDQFGQ